MQIGINNINIYLYFLLKQNSNKNSALIKIVKNTTMIIIFKISDIIKLKNNDSKNIALSKMIFIATWIINIDTILLISHFNTSTLKKVLSIPFFKLFINSDADKYKLNPILNKNNSEATFSELKSKVKPITSFINFEFKSDSKDMLYNEIIITKKYKIIYFNKLEKQYLIS